MRSNERIPSRAPRPDATGRSGATPWWPRLLDQLWSARETRILRSALRGTAALLFPVQCVCCRRPDASLCRPCATGLRRAGLHPGRVERHAEALPLNQSGQALPVIAAGKYEHELASVLLAYKNHQMVSLGRVLAPVLASALRAGILGLANPQAPVILVPVPTRRQARAGRHVPSGATGQWACCCGGWRPPGRCRQTRGSPTC
ncbi:hypothetical protein [Paeniglutamicibacter kerguelensis]|uniref:ComF family protein n=1 Tax=Paeniglutamicibacter kerguelensis TaxID=254788 RepID=A0ABS4XEK4_9MICC|nr:hypothetical protein [Paeniglutamicibacter kerguelensis]MBP2386678.1 hypothetical protein [Paeniglutamicibacter kerguelensis]